MDQTDAHPSYGGGSILHTAHWEGHTRLPACLPHALPPSALPASLPPALWRDGRREDCCCLPVWPQGGPQATTHCHHMPFTPTWGTSTPALLTLPTRRMMGDDTNGGGRMIDQNVWWTIGILLMTTNWEEATPLGGAAGTCTPACSAATVYLPATCLHRHHHGACTCPALPFLPSASHCYLPAPSPHYSHYSLYHSIYICHYIPTAIPFSHSYLYSHHVSIYTSLPTYNTPTSTTEHGGLCYVYVPFFGTLISVPYTTLAPHISATTLQHSPLRSL